MRQELSQLAVFNLLTTLSVRCIVLRHQNTSEAGMLMRNRMYANHQCWSIELTYLCDGHDSTAIRRRKTVESLNLANISKSDRMDEINLRTPILVVFWISRLALLISGALRTPKSVPSGCALFLSTVGYYEHFSCTSCAWYLKFRRFGSGCAFARNSRNFQNRESANHTFICLPLRSRRLHCALSLATQCNEGADIVIGPVCVFCNGWAGGVCLWDCWHDNSKCMHRSSPNWVCR